MRTIDGASERVYDDIIAMCHSSKRRRYHVPWLQTLLGGEQTVQEPMSPAASIREGIVSRAFDQLVKTTADNECQRNPGHMNFDYNDEFS